MGNKINANPTKEFFISMLTRDIDVKAAILELIDNSIDGAKRIRKNSDFSGLYIDIQFDSDKFIIEDNCGGMSVDIAQNYAFRFGRAKNRPHEEGNFTGIFGIGMKRALFRLGKKFTIESKTINDNFSMAVDVDEWIKDDSQDWSFDFSDVELKAENPVEKTGTKIVVSNLHEGIKQDFQLIPFHNSLINYLARYKTLIASSNLKISVNKTELKTYEEELIKSDMVTPYVHVAEVDGVKIKILAGLAPKGMPANAGWYIYCNGRTVIYADKTELTGWGNNGIRSYHPSLACFRGYVFFESKDLDKLPWNTSKTGVDTSAKVFINAKCYMDEATKTIISIYSDCTSNMENVEELDNTILDKNKVIQLNYVNLQSLLSKNQVFEIKQDLKPRIEYTNITFKVEKDKADRTKKILKAASNKELGERLFKYYWDREVGDD
ncbi:MAG: ATP-binding protein [Clostridia bacterium]|nr:ATP-binding protein [Clostridia bacterium]